MQFQISYCLYLFWLVTLSFVIFHYNSNNRVLQETPKSADDISFKSTSRIKQRSGKINYPLCDDPEFQYAYANGSCLFECDADSKHFIIQDTVINGFTQKTCVPCGSTCGTCETEPYYCLSCADPGFKPIYSYANHYLCSKSTTDLTGDAEGTSGKTVDSTEASHDPSSPNTHKDSRSRRCHQSRKFRKL